MSIHSEILNQLGGNKFLVMTGAKNLVNVGNGLQMSLPARFAKSGITKVVIKLNSQDLYDVQFGKMVRMEYRVVKQINSIPNCLLRDCFTRETGLDCTL